jgi:O-antigen/teichoic acid export membrane protein
MSLWHREWRRLRGSSLIRNTSWMVVGQGSSVLLQAAYFVMLARLLGAVQYGIFAGAFAFTSIVAQYGSLGTGVVFIRYVSGDRKVFAAYWGNILLVTVALGLLLTAVLYVIGHHLLNPYSAALVPLAGIANCLCAQLTTETGRVFQAFEQLQSTAMLSLLTSLMRTLAAGSLLLTLHHATALQWAVASTVVSIIAAGVAVANVSIRFGWPKFEARLFRMHALEGFGYSFAGSTTIFYNDIDKTMLSHAGMNLANGIYTMAYRVIDIGTIPVSAIQAASVSQFFQRGRSSLKSASDLSCRLLKRALPLSCLIAVIMFAGAPLIPKILGPGFSQSTSALRWLCLIPVFRSVQTLSGAALTGAGYQSYRTLAQVVAAALNFGSNLWLIPAYGWHGAAWSSLATDGAMGAMNLTMLQVLVWRETRGAKSRFCIRLLRDPVRMYSLCITLAQLAWLSVINHFLRAPITQQGGPVVSLTSYGKRIHTVHFTIESIGRGRVLPSRLILWLDDEVAFERLPAALRRLIDRGLEVKLCKNYGPHKKYYPYVESEPAFEAPLITADDDVLYPPFWLSGLMEAFRERPDLMHCYLAKVIALNDDGVAKYADWELSKSSEPSFRTVAHGLSGVLYPMSLLPTLKAAGDAFQRYCSKTDDLWLHVHALRQGHRVKQIRPQPCRFPTIPGTQKGGLWVENNNEGNDRAVRSTYTLRDIEILRTECNQ